MYKVEDLKVGMIVKIRDLKEIYNLAGKTSKL